MYSHLLGLDFDGVLHPAADVVHVPQGVYMPMWQVAVAMRAQGRFVWCDLLEQALGDSQVGIVIHSTWRRRFADSDLKQLLTPGLAKRVINLDGQISSRIESSADDYLGDVLDLIEPSNLLVLDDRQEGFLGGRVQKWIDCFDGEMIFLDPDKGINDPSVLAKLAAWGSAAMDVDARLQTPKSSVPEY